MRTAGSIADDVLFCLISFRFRRFARLCVSRMCDTRNTGEERQKVRKEEGEQQQQENGCRGREASMRPRDGGRKKKEDGGNE